MEVIIPLIACLIVIWLVLILPWQMAEKRDRSGFLWVVISIMLSPVVAILLLLALGEVPMRTVQEKKYQN